MNIKSKMLAFLNFLLLLPVKVYAGGGETAEGGFGSSGKEIIDQALNEKGNGTEETFNSVQSTLYIVLGFVRTAGIIISVLMLVWCAIQLASSAGNQQKRAMAMEGIKNVLIATAIIGGAAVISALALGILAK